MAKKEAKPETVIERSYNIPLRREWLNAPKWKRTKKAAKAAREFLQRHMKSDNVKIGKYLNEAIWKHGGKNPPHHIKVDVTKDSEGAVKAELAGAPKAEVPEKPKEEKAEPKKEEKAKPEEKKPAEKPKEKPSEAEKDAEEIMKPAE
jgi:large subunit ribosomal protein L31e